MMKLAEDIKLYDNNGFKGFGRYGLENFSSSSAGTLFGNFISRAVGVITIVAIIWFVFILVTGAIGIIGSGGDKQGLESSKKKIYTGLIGIVVLVSALFIARLVGAFLGIENFLSPALLIEQITK